MNFPDTCTIEPFSSNDGFDSSYGNAVSSPCYYKEESEKNIQGSIQIISAWVGLPAGTTIASTSRITLPDGTKPSIRRIKNVRRLSDNEVEYIRVILGDPSIRGVL